MMGVRDREAFRLSLRATLVKDNTGIPIFEELFPLFFGRGEVPPMTNLTDDLTPEEAEMLADALKQMSQRLRDLLERLMKGKQLSQEELDRLGKFVGLQNADDLRYREWMSRRMQQALGFPKVREALAELLKMMAELGMSKERLEQIRQLVQLNQQAMVEQLRQYAGEQIAEQLSRHRPDDDLEQLLNRPFSGLSDRDMDRLRKEVQRLATRLRSRIALRQKRAKSGQLDPKATIRANLKHNNVPIVLKHRDHHLKPKIVVICDISTSMRYCS
ncbi:MAG: VWA domain-containing protein, partial [Anaerolineales bacterium]